MQPGGGGRRREELGVAQPEMVYITHNTSDLLLPVASYCTTKEYL